MLQHQHRLALARLDPRAQLILEKARADCFHVVALTVAASVAARPASALLSRVLGAKPCSP